jgi:hypothetical protein
MLELMLARKVSRLLWLREAWVRVTLSLRKPLLILFELMIPALAA